jgi:hypothetical protein
MQSWMRRTNASARFNLYNSVKVIKMLFKRIRITTKWDHDDELLLAGIAINKENFLDENQKEYLKNLRFVEQAASNTALSEELFDKTDTGNEAVVKPLA